MSIFDKFRQISKQDDTPAGPVEYIIAGLGNPGEKYEGTRHNAGFIVMDALAEKLGFEMKKLKFKSLCADVSVSGKHCLVMKPSTFMNNSGQAISEAMIIISWISSMSLLFMTIFLLSRESCVSEGRAATAVITVLKV